MFKLKPTLLGLQVSGMKIVNSNRPGITVDYRFDETHLHIKLTGVMDFRQIEATRTEDWPSTEDQNTVLSAPVDYLSIIGLIAIINIETRSINSIEFGQ